MNKMKELNLEQVKLERAFPSPAGVNYYELYPIYDISMLEKTCFRPQQGLTIMNPYLQNPDKHYLK